jgi:hypothetical protein
LPLILSLSYVCLPRCNKAVPKPVPNLLVHNEKK